MTSKRKLSALLITAALIASVLGAASCGGDNSGDKKSSGDSSSSGNSASEEKDDTKIEDKVESANTTASELRDTINAFITDMEVKGTSLMRTKEGSIKIAIDGGSVTAVTDENILSAAAKKDNAFDTNLNKRIENNVSDIQNASIVAYIENGLCIGVVFFEGSTSMPSGVPGASDFAAGKFSWDGSVSGSTADGNAIGTSPVL